MIRLTALLCLALLRHAGGRLADEVVQRDALACTRGQLQTTEELLEATKQMTSAYLHSIADNAAQPSAAPNMDDLVRSLQHAALFLSEAIPWTVSADESVSGTCADNAFLLASNLNASVAAYGNIASCDSETGDKSSAETGRRVEEKSDPDRKIDTRIVCPSEMQSAAGSLLSAALSLHGACTSRLPQDGMMLKFHVNKVAEGVSLVGKYVHEVTGGCQVADVSRSSASAQCEIDSANEAIETLAQAAAQGSLVASICSQGWHSESNSPHPGLTWPAFLVAVIGACPLLAVLCLVVRQCQQGEREVLGGPVYRSPSRARPHTLDLTPRTCLQPELTNEPPEIEDGL
mmetsp:Transcript_16900/g.39326  ORF Transcript_16900/g.39326 Transcript_16900/m.39326 type:complete len:346 (+) Transcript_16900:25-1062(+)